MTNDCLQAMYVTKLRLEKKFNIANLSLQEKLVVDQDATSFLLEDNTNQYVFAEFDFPNSTFSISNRIKATFK